MFSARKRNEEELHMKQIYTMDQLRKDLQDQDDGDYDSKRYDPRDRWR